MHYTILSNVQFVGNSLDYVILKFYMIHGYIMIMIACYLSTYLIVNILNDTFVML